MSRAQHYLPSHCTGSGRTHGKYKREQERYAEQHMGKNNSSRERGKVVQTIIPKIITTPNMQTYYFTIMLL